MRVVINALTDLTPYYGSRVYLFNLARALADIPDVELILLVGQGQTHQLPAGLQAYAEEIDVPASRSYSQIVHALRIRKRLKEIGPGIWHLPNTLPLLGKTLPTVITIHDLADQREKKYGRVRTWYRRIVNYLGAHIADQIITVSLNSKLDIVHLLNIPEDKITVIHPGVDRCFRPLDRENCRDYISSTYDLPKDFILAPGGLARNKNVDGLLRAYHVLRETGTEHSLVCTGHFDSQEGRRIATFVQELDLAGKVFLTGHVPVEDLPKLYNASAAVAYLSLYEGFGLPVLEAMACGIPIVASDRSSIPEVAGNCALLVNPEDPDAVAAAINSALHDEVLRKNLVASGLARARQFTWQRTAFQTLAVYAKAMARSKLSANPVLSRAAAR
jgi:glycosyltransferase involved in cell wall biosynthesis